MFDLYRYIYTFLNPYLILLCNNQRNEIEQNVGYNNYIQIFVELKECTKTNIAINYIQEENKMITSNQ